MVKSLACTTAAIQSFGLKALQHHCLASEILHSNRPVGSLTLSHAAAKTDLYSLPVFLQNLAAIDFCIIAKTDLYSLPLFFSILLLLAFASHLIILEYSLLGSCPSGTNLEGS